MNISGPPVRRLPGVPFVPAAVSPRWAGRRSPPGSPRRGRLRSRRLLVAIFFAEIGVKPAQMTKLAVAIFLDQFGEIFDLAWYRSSFGEPLRLKAVDAAEGVPTNSHWRVGHSNFFADQKSIPFGFCGCSRDALFVRVEVAHARTVTPLPAAMVH